MEGGKVEDHYGNDHECEVHKKNVTINPLRIYVTATLGIVVANVMSIIFQKNIYANETRLLVAIFIVLFLLYYMYSICKTYMIWETTME